MSARSPPRCGIGLRQPQPLVERAPSVCRAWPPARPERVQPGVLRSRLGCLGRAERPSAFSARPRCFPQLTLTSAATTPSRIAVSFGVRQRPPGPRAPRRAGAVLPSEGGSRISTAEQATRTRTARGEKAAAGAAGTSPASTPAVTARTRRRFTGRGQPSAGSQETRCDVLRPGPPPIRTLPPRDLSDPSSAHHPVDRDLDRDRDRDLFHLIAADPRQPSTRFASPFLLRPLSPPSPPPCWPSAAAPFSRAWSSGARSRSRSASRRSPPPRRTTTAPRGRTRRPRPPAC